MDDLSFRSVGRRLRPRVVALGLCVATPAWGDSAQGVDTMLGNGLLPTGQDPTVAPGQAAVGTFRPDGSHSPTGMRYLVPPAYAVPQTEPNGWNYSLSVEAGFWGGDADDSNPLFRRYRDWHNGPSLNWFDFSAEKPADAHYVNFYGSDVGRKDQFYGLELGKYNDLRVKAFVDQIPHDLGSGTTYFQGAGSGFLSLPPSLTPAASSLAAVDAAAKAGTPYDFEVQRDRAGLRSDWTIATDWKAFGSYTYEHRDGSRPMGGSMFFPIPTGPGATIGGISEIIEPIDYRTQDIATGVQYASKLTQVNLTASASFFSNAHTSLTWANPYDVNAANPYSSNLKLGQMALAPDNQAYNLKAEYVHTLPELRDAHIDASVAVGRMAQNANLLAPSVNTGIGGNAPFTWNNADWNTTAALSQKTSEARIDTELLNLQFSSAVLDTLTVRANGRYYDTRNHTDYTAYNPITQQYGYLAEGGGQGTVIPGESGIYVPGGPSVQYRSIPFDGSQQNLSLDADYRVTQKISSTFSYEREDYLRHYRERARTWEDKYKLTLTDRAIGDGTLRASYEFDSRRGGPYNSNPYAQFYSSSLPGALPDPQVYTLAQMRKFDLSDRRQQIANLRYLRPLRDDLDLTVTLQQKLIDWQAEFGRVGTQVDSSINADLSWTPVDGTTGYAFYSFDRSRISQANVNDNTLTDDGSPNYGGNVYLTDDAWTAVSRDRADVVGLGLKETLARKFLLDVSYSLTVSSTAISYGYIDPGGAVLGSPGAPLPNIGNAFPDNIYRIHTLQGSLLIPASKNINWRIVARYEMLEIRDWHYTGLAPGALPSNTGGLLPATFIDLGPQDYHTLVLGVFIQYKFS